MGPPGGGPKDEEAPRIIEVNPPSGSTEVDPESAIEIVFSEEIDPFTPVLDPASYTFTVILGGAPDTV